MVAKWMARWLCLGLCCLCLVACGPFPDATLPPPDIPWLHIEGNRFVDGQHRPVFLRGVAADSLEYRCTGDGHFTAQDFAAMRAWNTNIVRIPLSAPFWLNANGICPDYRQLVLQVVTTAEDAGFYVLLSLFYIAPFPGQGNPAGAGYPMPDDQQSVAFWQSIAPEFAGDTRVLFEAYSEPHEWDNHDDIYFWTIWRDGGIVHNDQSNEGRIIGDYHSVGMQALVDIINQSAPDRIVLVNGMQWGGDLSYIDKGYALQGRNLAYSLHLYPGPRSQNPQGWPDLFGKLAARTPVLTTEFGQIDCGADFVRQAMPYLRDHTAGMIAWVWDVGTCQRPALITDWSGMPSDYGRPIHDFLAALP